MKAGRLGKKQRQDDQRRRKRAQAVSVLAQGARNPPLAIVAAKRSRPPSVGRAKAMPAPLSSAHYPIKRAALGRRQEPQTVGVEKPVSTVARGC